MSDKIIDTVATPVMKTGGTLLALLVALLALALSLYNFWMNTAPSTKDQDASLAALTEKVAALEGQEKIISTGGITVEDLATLKGEIATLQNINRATTDNNSTSTAPAPIDQSRLQAMEAMLHDVNGRTKSDGMHVRGEIWLSYLMGQMQISIQNDTLQRDLWDKILKAATIDAEFETALRKVEQLWAGGLISRKDLLTLYDQQKELMQKDLRRNSTENGWDRMLGDIKQLVKIRVVNKGSEIALEISDDPFVMIEKLIAAGAYDKSIEALQTLPLQNKNLIEPLLAALGERQSFANHWRMAEDRFAAHFYPSLPSEATPPTENATTEGTSSP
jgi:hypothetical protein